MNVNASQRCSSPYMILMMRTGFKSRIDDTKSNDEYSVTLLVLFLFYFIYVLFLKKSMCDDQQATPSPKIDAVHSFRFVLSIRTIQLQKGQWLELYGVLAERN